MSKTTALLLVPLMFLAFSHQALADDSAEIENLRSRLEKLESIASSHVGVEKAGRALSSDGLYGASAPNLAIIANVNTNVRPPFLVSADRTFANLGYTLENINRIGISRREFEFYIPSGMVLDEAAYLNLVYNHSALLNFDSSGLLIQLNGVPIGSGRLSDLSTQMTEMRIAIQEAIAGRDTLGGIIEIVALGLPAGLGSHVQWDRRLEARIGAAALSVQAIKGVEIGLGFRAGRMPGSQVHDPIEYESPKTPQPNAGFVRPRNGAGGLEGGITNGAPLVVRCAMKPISTLMKPLPSVDLRSGAVHKADVERSDVCALPAACVVAENMLAFVLARAFLDKFGGDSIPEIQRNYKAYLKQISVSRG